MARTSKTVIGGDSGEQSDRMTRAAASGAAAVQQAHSDLLTQYRSGADQANQNAALANQVVGQGIERQTQAEQFNRKMEQDESQFSRGLAQRQSETALEGAKAGFEETPSGGNEAAGGDRAAQLEQEMNRGSEQQLGPLDPESQQRLQDQGKKKMEMDPSTGRWRPTAEHTAQVERENTRKDFEADSERMRALAYRDQIGVSAQKALASGDKKTYEENVERLVATPNDMQKRYDRLMKDGANPNDWGELKQLAQGGPDADPSLMSDLDAKQWTPRVAAFVRAQVQKDALTSIVLSKGSTHKLEVDWTAPKMREFQTQVANLNDFMKSNPALGQLAFIKSTDDKMRFLNVMAASQVLLGMTQAPNPAAGMMPATAPNQQGAAGPSGPGAPPLPPGSTQVPGREAGANAVRNARAGGATPSQSLQAGQQANPTGAEPIDMSQVRFNN